MAGCEPFSARGNEFGVLVLHGFTGNPQSMRPLAEVLANHGYSVELPRLPGHGTSVEDMMPTTFDDYTAAADAAFEELAVRCSQVAVAGLSMGGTLSLWLAERRPEVAALVLINPLAKYMGDEVLAAIDGILDSGVEVNESIGSDIKREGSKEFSYPATPLRPLRTLLAAVKDVDARLEEVTAPTLLLSSREDHVVSPDNGDEVEKRLSGPVRRIFLEESFHVATLDNDASLIEASAVEFLASIFHP